MQSNIHIVRTEYIGDATLRIFFSDNTERVIDFKEFLTTQPHPQHNSFLEPKNFKLFTIEHGNVVWGKNWDMIFPIEDLYNFPR